MASRLLKSRLADVEVIKLKLRYNTTGFSTQLPFSTIIFVSGSAPAVLSRSVPKSGGLSDICFLNVISRFSLQIPPPGTAFHDLCSSGEACSWRSCHCVRVLLGRETGSQKSPPGLTSAVSTGQQVKEIQVTCEDILHIAYAAWQEDTEDSRSSPRVNTSIECS